MNTKQQSGDKSPHSKDWPHAPVHRLTETGVFMVTAGTYRKEHFFRTDGRLDLLESALLRLAKQYDWQLEAWAVFSNHYHFIGRSPADSKSLRQLITHFHANTAREVNKLDGKPSRKIWHNYWDTRLTFERSYLGRLNYVHGNAVHHKLAAVANQYRWCSAAWFERTCPPAIVKMIYSLETDQVKVPDDF
jgi:REP-associated tyrosine transposase